MRRLFLSILFTFSCLYAQLAPQIELKSIEFIGNNSISSSELSSVILSKESPGKFSQFLNSFSSFGNPPVYFDSLLIPMDLHAIKSLYLTRGFFKIKVGYEYKIDREGAVLQYIVYESTPVRFNSFVITGLENKIPVEFQEVINDYVRVDTSMVYSDAILEDRKTYTLQYLRDHGFMLASYDQPTLIVDTLLNRADVKINFIPGKRYIISEILIAKTGVGMDYVEDQLLKDIVGINPGTYYSHYNIQRGQVRLYRTELFNSAIINAIISDTIGNKVPLNLSADIGMLHELSPEIIINNEDNTFNLGLGLSFVKKNFLGDARKLTISTSAAAQNISEFIRQPALNDSTVFGYTDSRLSVEQPFLFGRPINTKIETYFTLQKRRNEYNSTLYGAKLSFDIELPQFTYLNSLSTYFNVERAEYKYKRDYLINLLSLSFQRIPDEEIGKTEADSLARIFVNEELGGQLFTRSTNALIGIIMGANKTDDVFFPSSGYSLSMLIEEANSIPYLFGNLFGSRFNRPLYIKLLGSAAFYLPVYSSRENSFGIKLKAGQIFNYFGDKADISLNQRFYAGGSNSVRGWSTRQLVPIEPLINLENPSQEDLEAILAKGAATGGFFLFEGSIESRNRLFGKFGTALFIDYGNTWNSVKEFRFDQVALAGGFGLRYYSDFAPIRLDFGIKLFDPSDKRNISSKKFLKELVQFHIGIGEAF
ncbi:MAG: BamA/TamA family outer membrane protein [Bacteroidota bacterium]